MTSNINDPELGKITIRTHPRAKNYTIKVVNGAVIATMPVGGSLRTMTDFIAKNRSKLIAALQKSTANKNILDETIDLQTNTFRLHIFRAERNNFYMSLKDGTLHIACPADTDFADERVQTILHKFLARALRHEGNRILPARLSHLSAQHGFANNDVKINKSKGRWGSCSTKGNINLSLYIMLLPDHLIDYVLLHELCHTREMNHSPRFWQLMDSVTNNQSQALRRELKKYRIP